MPIYAYKCERCRHEEDQVRRISERDELRPCPHCNESFLIKQVALTSLDPWKPIVLEHVEATPKRFETRKELQDYCKKKKLSSSMLL